MPSPRRPLVLTGGPAVGKSTTGRAIAEGRERAAFIDGDDVRQLVVAGAETLWSGPGGAAQHDLATRNIAALIDGFRAAGFETVVADYATPRPLAVYRERVPDVFVVHLAVTRPEARRRASTRRVFLTPQEFELLHDLAQAPGPVDLVLDVDDLSVEQQTDAVRAAWRAVGAR